MSIRYPNKTQAPAWQRRPVLVLALALALGQAWAGFNSPMLLFDTPTADVLPAGSLALSVDASLPLTNTEWAYKHPEIDASIRFSPLKRLDLAVIAYTLKDYVLDAKYQLVGSGPGTFGLAVGVHDLGIHNYVSPIGNGLDSAWPDWRYNMAKKWYDRPWENFSAFAVTSIPLASFARLNLGLGRGRFVGYDGPNEYLNTDIFFHSFHQWALALFGGLEVYVTPEIALVAEANNRDMNSGIKAKFGPVSAAVAWTQMEGLIFAKEDKFGRVEFGASYQFDFRRKPPTPKAPSQPAPLPEPEQPPAPPPIATKLRLNPIWFKWDKWDITPLAAATLRQNADIMLANPDMKVVVAGYASEEGSPEHNLPLSGRRAEAALEYLKSLGVPGERMRTEARGESTGRPLPMHRWVRFEIESEK
jgi:outer membrane protein OmpA-like peptidoglycan-associated protein